MTAHQLHLRAGDWVQVRSEQEILATLDAQGELDGLPFMAEMRQFCGRRLRVSKRAEKACDTIHRSGARRVLNAVHLEDLRCDGSGHGGCQAGCLFIWKEAWLAKTAATTDASPAAFYTTKDRFLPAFWNAGEAQDEAERVYRCQATQMFEATLPLRWWDLRQYWRDLASGNVTIARMLRAAVIAQVDAALQACGRLCRKAPSKLGRLATWSWSIKPNVSGPLRGKTPAGRLDLEPGEIVEVKSHAEILATLNDEAKNRGMRFDPEMVRYCGGRFRVLRRVERIVDERSGKMIALPNDCVILEGVTCVGDISACRLFCTRAIYPYWRELWLRRAPLPERAAHGAAVQAPQPVKARPVDVVEAL